MSAVVADDRSSAAARVRSLLCSPDAAVVFALALAVRLLLVATGPGGFTGDYGYDAGVYYTAADALVHGRLPYADFLLLHPPGLMLVLTPFAVLGRLTTDHAGFIVANLAFSALGALNAALVHRIARQVGLGRRAALLGGVFYALWLSAAGPEISARLEPLGTFAFLVALTVLTRSRGTKATGGRAQLVAGVALGFAVCVKIWWIVPLLVVVAWSALRERDARGTRQLATGAGAAMLVVLGPFFLRAPGAMWRMIVADQLGRHPGGTSPVRRIYELSGLTQFGGGHAVRVVASALIAVAAAFLVRAAWRHRAARLIVVVALAQVVVLLASPTYFGYYSGFAAATIALVVAAAAHPAHPLQADGRGRLVRGVPVLVCGTAAAATAAALVTGHAAVATTRPLALGHLPAAVAHMRCVTADSPMALIALDTLSRGLADGCPNWVDVSGRTYDVDAVRTRPTPRSHNVRWQGDIVRYLRSGQAAIVIRSGTGLDAASRAAIRSWPVLARSGRFTIYRTGS